VTSLHDFTLSSLEGEQTPLSNYRGKVVLVVNVASRCGLTPQYDGLVKLHHAHDDVVVLGFPCNQFAGQEPGSAEEIRSFCSTTYGVDFPLFEKIDVNGAARHPLYAWLTAEATSPDGPGDITWNFAKFVVGKDGQIVARFSPRTSPDDPALLDAIARARG
jgi:glutathione peroxidase